MSGELFIWITRWEDFQHYKPERDRGPAWIKQHVAQLHDERYLGLTMVQRALLHDTRLLFSAYRGRLSSDTRALTHKIGHRITSAQLEALNHAGLIEFVSRETLDQRLEKLYSSPRAPARSREVELEVDTPLPPADAGGEDRSPQGKTKSPRVPFSPAKPTRVLERALAFTRNAGVQYEPTDYAAEIDRYDLADDERQQVEHLYAQLREALQAPVPAAVTNGQPEELPWEGEAPPALP